MKRYLIAFAPLLFLASCSKDKEIINPAVKSEYNVIAIYTSKYSCANFFRTISVTDPEIIEEFKITQSGKGGWGFYNDNYDSSEAYFESNYYQHIGDTFYLKCRIAERGNVCLLTYIGPRTSAAIVGIKKK